MKEFSDPDAFVGFMIRLDWYSCLDDHERSFLDRSRVDVTSVNQRRVW